MKKSIKNSLIIVASLAVGYCAGIIIGVPDLSSEMGRGDVSKVSAFRKALVGPQYSAYEEKLLADSLAMQQEKLVTETLAETLQEFATLVDNSIVVAGDIQELESQVNALREIREMSDNAATAGELAKASLDNLQNGNKEDLGISYEQAAQNMVIAYMIVDDQARTGREFALAADQYYANHPEKKDLADLRDNWAVFCCNCEMLKGNDSESKFWAANTNAKIAESALSKTASERFSKHQYTYVVQKTAEALSQHMVSKAEQSLSQHNIVSKSNNGQPKK